MKMNSAELLQKGPSAATTTTATTTMTSLPRRCNDDAEKADLVKTRPFETTPTGFKLKPV